MNMREKIARALLAKDYPDDAGGEMEFLWWDRHGERYLDMADAALDALMKPTRDMVRAGEEIDAEMALDTYSAMIRAAKGKQMTVEKLMADMLYGKEVTNTGLLAFARSVMKGKLDPEDAIIIIEQAPRLAEMLIAGVGGIYGKVDYRRLIELARNGQINGGVLSRAMK